jgi:cyclin M-like protein
LWAWLDRQRRIELIEPLHFPAAGLVHLCLGEVFYAAQVGVAQVRAAQVGAAQVGAAQVGAAHVGAAQVGAQVVGAAQVGAAQVGVDQTGAAQVGADQTGAAQVGADQTGAAQVGADQVGAAQVGADQTGAAQVGTPQFGAAQVGAPQVGAAQVGVDQVLILGELVPKQIALANAERVAARVARPMQLVARVGGPLVAALGWSSRVVLRLLGAQPREQTITEEEIISLVAEGAESGVLAKMERRMIEGVLRLADRPVRSIMTPRPDVVWIDPEDYPQDSVGTPWIAPHSTFRLLAVLHRWRDEAVRAWVFLTYADRLAKSACYDQVDQFCTGLSAGGSEIRTLGPPRPGGP